MSLATTRQAIGEALSGVDGVTGYPKQPRAVAVFDAWPMWEGAAPAEDGRYGRAFVETWRVYIVAPTDVDAADAFISARLDDLLEALQPHLSVTGYGPARLTLDGSSAAHNALMISGETE